jgi:uncharacterized repeat protein (TIGR01451 family)
MKKMNASIKAMLFSVAMLPLAALAEDKVVFKSEVFQEVTVTEDGKSATKLVPAEKVLPGEEVVYILSFSNEGDSEARDLVINNPIPEHTWYRQGSAFGAGTQISVSVDGGKRYGNLIDLDVTLANGEQRAATFKDVSHVRWTVNYALQPGKTGTVSYRAVVQ